MIDVFSDLAKIARENLKAAKTAVLEARDGLDPKIRLDNLDILGRDELATKIAEEFDAVHEPVVLWGAGGVGKTAAADHYARIHVQNGRYVGAWRISGESISGAAQDLGPLGRHLGIENKNNDEAYYRDILKCMREGNMKGQRWLLIHDNIDDEAVQKAALSRFTDTAEVDHLITSRLSGWQKRATTIRVDEPEDEAPVMLLAREAEREPDAALAELAVKALGALPLALMVVGADLRDTGMSIAEYGESYAKILDQVPGGETIYDKSLAAAVLGSFQRLSEDAQAVLTLAAFMAPEDIDPDYLEKGAAVLAEKHPFHMLANDTATRRRAFAAAAKHSLLRTAKAEDETGQKVATWRIHRLTQLVLRDKLEPEMMTWFVGLAAQLGRVQYAPNVQYDVSNWKKYRRLAKQADAVAPLLDLADEDGAKAGSSFINSTALFVMAATGDLELVSRIYEQNLPVMEKAFGRLSQNYAAGLCNLGGVLGDLGLSESNDAKKIELDCAAEQNLKDALGIITEVLGASDQSVSYVMGALQNFYWSRERFKDAEKYALAALKIREDSRLAANLIGTAHGNLGSLYSRWVEAVPEDQRAELLVKERHHKTEGLRQTRIDLGELNFPIATRLQNLAISYFRSGDFERALKLQIRAAAIPLALERNRDIPPNHPETLENLDMLHQMLQAGNDTRDPRALAEADIDAAIADHLAWEQGKTPNWPE